VAVDISPGDALKLSPDDMEKLGHELADLIEDFENQQKLRLRNIHVQWSWYEAKPLLAVRSDPWEGASNIVVPIIRTAADATAARYYSATLGTGKIWVGSTQNDEFEDFVIPVQDFLNQVARREMHLESAVRDGIYEMCVVGSTHWGLRWVQREKVIFTPGTKGKPSRQRVILSRGPVLDHIPLERIIYDTNYTAWEAPVISKQAFFTYPEMLSMAAQKYWDEEAVERVRSSSIANSSLPSVEVFLEKRKRAGSPLEDTPEPYLPHDIREVHVDWPFLKGLNLESLRHLENSGDADEMTLLPIIATLHMETKQVMRAIAKPYFIPDNPFYSAHFRKRPGSSDSPGLAKLLDHIQHGVTTIVNQSIDAVTFGNSIMGVTTDPKLQNQRFSPSKMVLVNAGADVQFPAIGKAIQPDLALIGLLTSVGERVANVSDPQLGRDVRMGGHPSPATSTMALLQENNMLHRMGIQELRWAVSRIGMDVATLFQQFETDEDGHIARAIGEADARMVKQWLFPRDMPIYGNLELDLSSLSESMNPEASRMAAMQIDQATTNHFARILQFLQVAVNPQAHPLLKEAALSGAKVATLSFKRILQSSEVDDPEKFQFNLTEAMQHAQQQIEQLSKLTQAGGQGGQPPQGAPPGPGPAGPGMLPGGGMVPPGAGPPAPEGPPPEGPPLGGQPQ
jgi:hypothetical protein